MRLLFSFQIGSSVVVTLFVFPSASLTTVVVLRFPPIILRFLRPESATMNNNTRPPTTHIQYLSNHEIICCLSTSMLVCAFPTKLVSKNVRVENANNQRFCFTNWRFICMCFNDYIQRASISKPIDFPNISGTRPLMNYSTLTADPTVMFLI